MDILGSIGQLYTFVLLALLILGFGLAAWAVINFMLKKKEHIEKFVNSKLELLKKTSKSGGNQMKNNNFIKLAVFSFMGIIVSVAILSVLPSMSKTGNNMYANGMYGNGAMTGTTMQGMSNTTMQNSMTGQYPDTTAIQQQLNMMQQQINQLQYQLSNSSMSNSSMSNSGSMSNNGSMSNSGSSSNSSSSGGMSMGMM